MASTPASSDQGTLADFFRLLRQRLVLIVFVAVVVFATTAVVTAFLPKWYLATAKVRVEKPEGEVKLFQAQGNNYYDPAFLQDQFRIMQSAKILQPVIANLKLGERLAGDLGVTGTLPPDLTQDYLTGKMLRLESPRGSSFIEISVFAREPALAAEIANEVARVYSSDRIAFATSEQSEGVAKLQQELAAQEAAVSRQRDEVEKLRKDLNIAGVDLNARYSDMEIETLRQMQNSLIALSVDAIGRKTRWERFKSIPPDERVGLVNSEVIQDANIQSLLQAYLVADQKVTQLKSRLGEAHPELVAAVDNRAKIREQLDAQLHGYESALEMAYKEADARVAELKSQLAQAKVDQILSARDRVRPFEEAAQKLDDETRLFTTLKLTLRQREIDFQSPKRSIELLDPAVPARQAARPSWIINLVLAFCFGGALGIGAAVLVEYCDTSFRNVADLEKRLGRPVLGVIPFASSLPLALDAADPAATEPYRVLHTNINLAAKSAAARTLVLLSAGPGEGKSTTLHILARVMAAAGERVLLVDSDLRRPTQHRLAGTAKSPGLSDWLLAQAPLDAVIQRGLAPGLDFIPAGGGGHLSLGLLQAERLKGLITELQPRYDRILFDAPPVIGVSDTTALASVVEDVVLLVQHRRNPADMVLRAQQIVEAIRKPLLGVVLNQVPPRGGDDYGYYTRNYDYYSHRGGHEPPAGRTAPDRGPERIAFPPSGGTA